MRHQLSGRQLSRNAPHRWAMLRNMAASLLRHETIRTTVPKAKELRRIVEPLITLGKADSQSNRRLAFARLRDAEVVAKLFEDLGPRFNSRPGGYTRILKMDPRPGDATIMALVQLVDQAQPAQEDTASEAGDSKQAKAAKKGAAASKKKAAAKKAKAAAESAEDDAQETASKKKSAARKKKSK